jgi:hypothetical protein
MICCEEKPGPHMDIVVWLRNEAAFRENEIDETVLPILTGEDLKELGVIALGHWRKLLDAIAALRNDARGKTPSVDAAAASSAPRRRAKATREGPQPLSPHQIWSSQQPYMPR